MSCKLNNGSCNHCQYFVKTTSIVSEADSIVLTIPEFPRDLYNNTKICICIAQNIPPEASAIQKIIVEIADGGGKYTLQDNFGNFVYADQLRARRVYHTTLATDSKLLTVPRYELCRTNHEFPVVVQPTPPA